MLNNILEFSSILRFSFSVKSSYITSFLIEEFILFAMILDLADKYKVRDYITEKGYGHMLTKLYGVWTDARSIDFDKLPNKFILKCNHDCGSYCLVDKSSEYDKQKIIKKLNHSLKNKYGYKFCEPHYNKIKPLVIAEEFLEEKTDNPISTSLI